MTARTAPRLAPLIALALCSALALVAMGCNAVRTPQGWSAGEVAGDSLFIGTMDGELLAIDKNNGDTLWRRQLPTPEDSERAIYGQIAVADDALFVGGYDGVLYAYGLDGDQTWQERLDGRIVGGPVVYEGLVLVGAGVVSSSEGSGGALYAVDIATNDPVWSFHADGPVWSPPTVIDGVAYVGSLDHNVYAVDVSDGSEIWRYESGGAVVSGIAVSDGVAVFGGFDSKLYALDAETGLLEWSFDGSTRWYWSRPLVADGVVYAPSLDGTLYALDAETGFLEWTFPTEGQLVGSPAIVNGDMIAVPVAEGGNSRVMLLETNGSLQAACRIGEDIRTSIEADGDLIYFAAEDRTIRALRIKPNGNPDEEWVYLTNEDDPQPIGRTKAC